MSWNSTPMTGFSAEALQLALWPAYAQFAPSAGVSKQRRLGWVSWVIAIAAFGASIVTSQCLLQRLQAS